MHEKPEACGECRELLPWYVAGTLSMPERSFVAEHLARCAECAGELAAWRGLAQTVAFEGRSARSALTATASWERFAGLLRQSEQQLPVAAAVRADSAPLAPHGGSGMGISPAAFIAAGEHFWHVSVAQARLLRPGVWIASVLGIVLAALYAALVPSVSAGNVLTFALPLIAATGMAFLYGPENDPALELALGTPTSARAVMLGRFLILFGYDAALALASTAVVAVWRGENVWLLVSLWLGPMALLSTVSLVLSLLVNPIVAGGIAAGLWFSRLLHLDGGASVRLTPDMLWHTSPQILAISLGLLLVALFYAPRQERLASEERFT